ncbi:Golgi-associated RAB2 interactor protein 3-like isoform X3 [Rhea pennata]|uniref:Golgi-associated RAB2 interactor protein 3-like isoform X3 n=1 Tax=Rhea pennata TaxID=8795 RepID=UPI002E26471A
MSRDGPSPGVGPAGGPAAGMRLGVEGGQLCRLLRSPDYNLFPRSAVFESNFLQVTRTGSCVDIHNAATPVTLGVTSSDPCLPLPNVLVVARGSSPPERPGLTLSRVLPLRLVQLSVPAGAGRLLRVRTVMGKVHYLCLHPGHPDAVFALWVRLAHILRHGLSFTAAGPDISAGSSVAELAPDGAGSSAARVWAQPDSSIVRRSSRCFWPALEDPAREEGAGVPIRARDAAVPFPAPPVDKLAIEKDPAEVLPVDTSGPILEPGEKHHLFQQLQIIPLCPKTSHHCCVMSWGSWWLWISLGLPELLVSLTPGGSPSHSRGQAAACVPGGVCGPWELGGTLQVVEKAPYRIVGKMVPSSQHQSLRVML